MKSITENFSTTFDLLLDQITTERFIEITGFDKSTVSQWKNAQRGPGDGALNRLHRNMKLPQWFRDACDALINEKNSIRDASPCNPRELPTESYDLYNSRDPLDVDGNGIRDERDALEHTRRATQVLEEITGKGGRR
jgi:transcriptional regulator with XRE-family HTH domain